MKTLILKSDASGMMRLGHPMAPLGTQKSGVTHVKIINIPPIINNTDVIKLANKTIFIGWLARRPNYTYVYEYTAMGLGQLL